LRIEKCSCAGTKNDFDLHPVQGFPTLLFFPANSKTPRPVQGRDARSLINAVVSNSAFQNLNVDVDALPKSGVVPQALAQMFPALEEGVLALQSYVMYAIATFFHYVFVTLSTCTDQSPPSISLQAPSSCFSALLSSCCAPDPPS
jgi:hypothetical protein